MRWRELSTEEREAPVGILAEEWIQGIMKAPIDHTP